MLGNKINIKHFSGLSTWFTTIWTTELDLVVSVMDMFGAGSDTTASTLRWAIMHMAKYPQVQTRLQQELDALLPKDTPPALHHKEQLVESFDLFLCHLDYLHFTNRKWDSYKQKMVTLQTENGNLTKVVQTVFFLFFNGRLN